MGVSPGVASLHVTCFLPCMFVCDVSFACLYIVGNSDGLFKGKRYFKCLPKHGKMVRIIDVLSVLYKVCYCKEH